MTKEEKKNAFKILNNVEDSINFFNHVMGNDGDGESIGEELLDEESIYGLFAYEVDLSTGKKIEDVNGGKAVETGSRKELAPKIEEYESSWNVNPQGKAYKFFLKRLTSESLEEDLNPKLKLPHLQALLDEFNAPVEWEFEGEKEVEDSPFHFAYRVEGDQLKIYDEHEEFHIDYGEEFGYRPRDRKLDKIEQALKEDGFGDEVLEWENNVIMPIHIPDNLLKEDISSLEEGREYESPIFGYINGTLSEFDPEAFIAKVRERKSSLHTNRMFKDEDNEKICYHIVCSLMGFGLVDSDDVTVWIDIVKETWIRNTDYDADDFRSYQGEEYQDRVLMVNCGNKEDKWEKAIETLNDFKANPEGKNSNESLEEAVDIHIEGNDVIVSKDLEEVAIIPVDDEGEEQPKEESLNEEWQYCNCKDLDEVVKLSDYCAKNGCKITAKTPTNDGYKCRIEGPFDNVHKVNDKWSMFKWRGTPLEEEIKEESLNEDMKPWIMQQGENGEPEFIGFANSHDDALKLVNPDGVTEHTYISELDNKDIYLGLKDKLEQEDIEMLDKYFDESLKEGVASRKFGKKWISNKEGDIIEVQFDGKSLKLGDKVGEDFVTGFNPSTNTVYLDEDPNTDGGRDYAVEDVIYYIEEE